MLYQSIQLDSTHKIRLLCVHPHSSSSLAPSVQPDEFIPIHCDLYPVVQEDNPHYEALSYTWGDESDTLPIYVNGIELQVTRNLRIALEHLRDETAKVFLWVDALCINQKDNAEKTEQLKIMRDIYANASRTRVWLGPAVAKSDKIIAELAEIGKAIIGRGVFELMIKMSNKSIQNPADAQQAEEAVQYLIKDMLEKSYAELDRFQHLLTGCCDLLSRPYWQRVWILQEIVVSPKADICCGESTIELAHLHAAIMYVIYSKIQVVAKLVQTLTDLLDTSGDEGPYPELEIQFNSICSIEIPPSVSSILGMRLQYQTPLKDSSDSELDLMHLLNYNRVGRQAKDPRDRIFALLGMAADTEALSIVPKYEEPNCIAIYCQAARAMIASGQVDLLSFSQPNKANHDVPSWVPDWREEVKEPSGLLPWNTPYSASGEIAFSKHPELHSLSFEYLKLNGCQLDFVESLKPQCNSGAYLGMKDRRQAAIYLNDIMSLCQISNQKLEQTGVEIYLDPSDREQAYQRIPVADLYSTGFFRRATVQECQLGHAEVITDYLNREKGEEGLKVTNTLRSYYILMGRQVSRRPFVTAKGFVGLAPSHVREGDLIVIFPGAKFPYALRRADNGMYTLIGETYVHGIMYGEFMKSGAKVEEFLLK